VSKIKEKIAADPELKEKTHTIFETFATNPTENLKSFNAAQKKQLLSWLIEYIEPTTKDERVPFFDLWRLLLAEDNWLPFYCHDHGAHFQKFVEEMVSREKDFSRPTRVFGYRAITNVFNCGEGRGLVKKTISQVNEIVLGAFNKYREDKTGLVALMWLSYNIAACQNDIGLKEEDANKYVETIIQIIEKEKDDRLLHGGILTLINLTYKRPKQLEIACQKKVGSLMKEIPPGDNVLLKQAIEDLDLILEKKK
jgi:hypothetical protein